MSEGFYRIVVPTDFSDCSQEAWELARRVAAVPGSELVPLYREGVLNRALLGSVADRVVRLAPCPVLTVREPV